MPESIRDGSGKGYLAGVTNERRLQIGGVTVSKEHHTNFEHQDTYNILFTDVTPTGAGDVFLYVKNTSADPIVCEGFSIFCPTDEIISICLGGSGTPSGGTDVEPANLTAGAGHIARGVFQTGSDITGINGSTEVARYGVSAGADSKFRNFDADLVIPQNQVLCMSASNGSILLNGFLVMWHDHGGI